MSVYGGADILYEEFPSRELINSPRGRLVLRLAEIIPPQYEEKNSYRNKLAPRHGAAKSQQPR